MEYLEQFKTICESVSPTNHVPTNHILKSKTKDGNWVSYCGKTFGGIYDWDSDEMPNIERVRIGKCCIDALARNGLTIDSSLPGWKEAYRS